MRTEQNYFERVYAVVRRIPAGRVTTYGHIAAYLGLRSGARMVGWALCALKSEGNWLDVPAHRVVNRRGELTGRLHFGGYHVMEDLLRAEGVRFLEDGRVDLDRHLWVPT